MGGLSTIWLPTESREVEKKEVPLGADSRQEQTRLSVFACRVARAQRAEFEASPRAETQTVPARKKIVKDRTIRIVAETTRSVSPFDDNTIDRRPTPDIEDQNKGNQFRELGHSFDRGIEPIAERAREKFGLLELVAAVIG